MQNVQSLAKAFVAVVMFCLPLFVAAQQPTVVPSDCVKIRYIQGLWLNPPGSRLAYLVKAPNLADNRNESNLYIRDTSANSRSQGQLIVTAEDVAGVMWSQRGDRVAMLGTVGGQRQITIVSASSRERVVSVSVPADTDSFSIDGTSDTIAYSVLNPAASPRRDPGANAAGYLVTYGDRVDDVRPTHSFYVTHRTRENVWSKPELLSIRNPITHLEETSVIVNSHFTQLSLSPDGKQLLFQYMTPKLPEQWYGDPIVKLYLVQNTLFEILVRYDLATSKTTLAFNSISVSSVPVWSRDSKTFFVNAYSPVGSSWEQADIRDHLAIAANANLFSVDIDSGRVDEIVRKIDYYHEAPEVEDNGESLEVHISGNTIARVRHDDRGWHELRREQIPSGEADRISAVVSSGRSTFVVSETVTTPQEIFEYTSEDPTMRVLTDLNPQLRFLRLATAKTIHWQVNGEYEAAGLLFLPPDYVQGKRYPLVIQTKGEQGWFACDSGSSHLPSFAPQPIATAGIAYLAPSSDGTQSSSDKPHGPNTAYPGGVGEAVQQMEMWDSAVDSLARLGIVDPTRVGIIGFSRTGFHVEFDITQAKTHYAAATAADNINYSLAEYLFLPYTSHAEIAMFGGPPFGDTLGNWERYSISYNLDRVHTPLLMEQMGYGVCDDDPNKIPLGLVTPYEIYRGLRLREKPVEMYYYPEDVHQPDHPLARLASLQRNVDWYRFWLQNYEDPLPSKQEQYKRWREMRRVFSLNR